MRANQRTIKYEVTYSGTGLHTGNKTSITFKPAPPNTGLIFRRIDIPDCPGIPATIDYVIDISRGTTLGINEIKIHTVEHVLAAITGLQIDNVYIELNGNEPPVGDGSAKPFVDELLKAGFEEQDALREFCIIDQAISFKDEENQIEMVALPLDDFRVTIMVDYNNPALGSQHSGLFSLEKEFITEFAPTRTFSFLHEIETLYDLGLIRGGELDNAIVIVDKQLSQDELERIAKKMKLKRIPKLGDNGILDNVKLRFKNEPARHKVLDMIGDLALIGAPIKGQILAARSGHRSNIEFVKEIYKHFKNQKLLRKYQPEKKKGLVFDSKAIEKILPHRYPILLVDRITECDMDKRIVGIKNVTFNEPFFQGHFPGHPVMPGVLIVEAMAQTGGILLLSRVENPDSKLVMFMGIDGARFRKPVLPGDQLRFELELISFRRMTCKMKAKAFVDETLVCEATLLAIVVEKEGLNNQ